MTSFKRSDFHYELPNELIARYPAKERTGSRLMVVNSSLKQCNHLLFHQIRSLFQPGDLLVLNHTKVIPARFFASKSTGGKVEIMLERVLSETCFIAQMRSSKPCKAGDELFLLIDGERLRVTHRSDRFYQLERLSTQHSMSDWIRIHGEIPLPPYMNRQAELIDQERYQTVYAKHEGSVAAPTAGLHFDELLLAQLKEDQVEIGYVNLQVGAGTFLPVREDDIQRHTMHSEYYEISDELAKQVESAKQHGKRVIAVGTTSLRALESSACSSGRVEAKSEETSLFIFPGGFEFKVVDVLITNFHLPESTLLMLVSAFSGYETIKMAYQEAIDQKYRFFSYGDAMWLDRQNT